MGQDSGPPLGHDDVVLDSDAAPAWDVNSRLDREDHAGCDYDLATLAEPHAIVDRAADRVSQSVAEVLLVSGSRDEVARHGIDCLAVSAGNDRFESALLGFEHDRVNFL